MPVPALHIEHALPLILDGDIGLLHPTTREGRWIVRLSRSWYSHAVLFFWQQHGRSSALWICEQIEPEGREIPARPYILDCPSGTFTVFRPKKALRYKAGKAVDWARQNVPGVPYDKKGLWRAFWSHAPFIRWWLRPSEDDEANGGDRRPLYCSAAVARASRLGGGLDLVPGLADHWTEPGDLAKSAALDRLFTITHSGKEGSHGPT